MIRQVLSDPTMKLIKPDNSKTTNQKLDLITLSINDLNDEMANPVNVQSKKMKNRTMKH